MGKPRRTDQLTPFKKGEQRTVDAAKKGAAASAETFRRRRAIKEALDIALSMSVPDIDQLKFSKSLAAELFGIPKSKVTMQDASVAMAVLQSAQGGRGALDALTFIRDTTGEAPTKELKLDHMIPEPLIRIKDSD